MHKWPQRPKVHKNILYILFNGTRKEYLNVLKPILIFFLQNILKGDIKTKPIKIHL
jgi:hypothetical protein